MGDRIFRRSCSPIVLFVHRVLSIADNGKVKKDFVWTHEIFEKQKSHTRKLEKIKDKRVSITVMWLSPEVTDSFFSLELIPKAT